MIKIVNYEDRYAEEMSMIILSNLYEINIKDHGKEVIDRIASLFSVDAIKKSFPKRAGCFVAIEDGKVVGTASLDRLRGDETGTKYIILTVFVNMNNQHQGIGRMLIEKVESLAHKIGAKTLVIPASVRGLEFYRKLGYDYLNGIKEQNEDKEYMLEKSL